MIMGYQFLYIKRVSKPPVSPPDLQLIAKRKFPISSTSSSFYTSVLLQDEGNHHYFYCSYVLLYSVAIFGAIMRAHIQRPIDILRVAR